MSEDKTTSLPTTLTSLLGLLGSLKGSLTSATSNPTISVAMKDPSMVWSNEPGWSDATTSKESPPPPVLCRFVTDHHSVFVAERATERAALGEPKWSPVDMGLPPEATAFLAATFSDKVKLETSVRSAMGLAQSCAMILRAVVAGQLSLADLGKASVELLRKFSMVDGPGLMRNANGFYVGTYDLSAPPVALAQPAPTTSPMVEQESPPSGISEPRTAEDGDRVRYEWITNDEPRKLVYDRSTVRFYRGATNGVEFSFPAQECTEATLKWFASALDMVHL